MISSTTRSSAPHSEIRWWHSSNTTTRTPASRRARTRRSAVGASSCSPSRWGSLPSAAWRLSRATVRAISRSRRCAAWPLQVPSSASTSSSDWLGGGRALVRPVTPRGVAQHVLGIGRLADRLVGQRVDVVAAPAEERLLVAPLALDRLARAQHERRPAEAPHDLEADHGLARPGRRDDQRLVAAGGTLGLEGLQAARLVAAPGAFELPGGEGGGHGCRVPLRIASDACRRPPVCATAAATSASSATRADPRSRCASARARTSATTSIRACRCCAARASRSAGRALLKRRAPPRVRGSGGADSSVALPVLQATRLVAAADARRARRPRAGRPPRAPRTRRRRSSAP